ncbi:transcription antitermination factor NusB [candidate division WOR-3 bacterium]|uniref:Transcription antitermination protein NusB n=1 Tax=candidate division WOR-3 bacterium TaxID=2052148 RepID=A0A660SKH0_UNCW3|nr:MAG: transcription antitermination factor NusB [candidate division WOR-3 bacterium]
MRHRGRKVALEAIYRFANTKEDPDQALADIITRDQIPEPVARFAREIVSGVEQNLDRIDRLITEQLKNWDMDRLSLIDQAILRIGVFELLEDKIPYQAVIDEAIRLAKEFGGTDSYRFVNGVLDAVRKRIG